MINNLTDDELVGWLCLFECLHIVNAKCTTLNLDYEYVMKKQVNPHLVQRYIADRFPIMCNALEQGHYAGSFVAEFLYNNAD